MDSKPVQPHKFHNLEVSGSWNGEFEGPVRVRISLEIQSAPDTQLRLLDTKSSAIFLKTATARLLSDESNDSSSLFAFSTPDSDKLKGARRVSAEKPPNSDEAFSASQDGPPLPSCSVMKEITTSRDTSSANLPYSEFTTLCINVAESEDLTDSPRQKRSATDASLADYGFGYSDAPTHKREMSSNETNKTIGPVSRSASRTGGESSQAGKLLGLETWLETAAQQNEDKAVDRGLADIGGSGPFLEGKNPENRKTATDDATGTEIYGQSAPVTESPDSPPMEPFPPYEEFPVMEEFPETERPYTRSPEPRSSSLHGQEGSPSGLSASVDFDPGMREGLEGPSSDPSILFSTPRASHSESGAWEKHYVIEETDGDDVDDDIQPLIDFWSDPKLFLSNGDLIVEFSRKVRQGTYKIDVNLTMYVDDDYIKGWSTILLPGLPHLQADETGCFLFCLPKDRGLEFYTTDMRRCQMVKDCFFAEFTSKGYLAVPMRVCGRRFYGFLKDFVVDQELISYSAAADSEAENKGSTRYCAMCSVRLSPRYICSEKCGYSFYVDGGPDGFFVCKLEHLRAGLQMIEIPNSESATIGVSRVQVICSPKDLGVFCLVWSDRHRHAIPWLPRIYAKSPNHPEGNRDRLRDIFTELSKREFFKSTKLDVKRLANDAGVEEGGIPDDKAGTDPDPDDVPELPGVLLLLELLLLTLEAKILQFIKGCITTANRFMSRLGQWMCSSMMRLILIFGAAYTLLGMVIWFFLRDASLDVSNPVQGNQSIPMDMCGLNAVNHTMVERIDAGVSVSFDDDVFKPDQPSIRAAEPVVDTEDTESARQVLTENTDSDTGDSEVNLGDHQTAGTRSFRDRIDYRLGWRGPVNGRA